MIATGMRISGGSYVGQATLSTLGDQLFWYDYRRAVLTSGGLVTNWGDLSKNNFVLEQSISSRRLTLYSDGIGSGDSTVPKLMKGVFNSKLNCLHNGSAYGFYIVFSYDYISGTNVTLAFLQTSLAGFPGVSISVLADTGSFRRVSSNDSTSQSRNTANSTTPENEVILVRQLFTGTSSTNSLRTIIKDNSITLTAPSLTPSSNNAGQMNVLSIPTAQVNFKMKMMSAYDFTGKTPSEIDALDALIVATIKGDPEYTALTT